MKLTFLILLATPALALAQVSPNFKVEAPSSLPTAQSTASRDFLLHGSLGNVFSQVSTSVCLEVAAGIVAHQLPEELRGPFIDRDRDGLADGWEIFYFGDLTTSGQGDPDADGEDNRAEQLAATNPLLASSLFRLRTAHRVGPKVSLLWTGAENKPYRILFSPDLGLTNWIPIGTVSTGATGIGTFNDTDSTRLSLPRGFYRVALIRE